MIGNDRAPSAEHLDDDRCADLVLHLLSEEARDDALVHAERCPACEERLRAHASAADRSRAEARERFAPPVRAAVRERRVLAFPRFRLRMGLLAAAAAALAVAVAIPLLRPRMPERPADRWLPRLGEEVRTRSDEAADPRLEAGLEAYRIRDLAAADRELSAASATGGTELLRRLYLAHVKLARDDSRSALQLLRSLDWQIVPEPWRREGIVLLAQALRLEGEVAAADSLERALRAIEPGTPFVP